MITAHGLFWNGLHIPNIASIEKDDKQPETHCEVIMTNGNVHYFSITSDNAEMQIVNQVAEHVQQFAQHLKAENTNQKTNVEEDDPRREKQNGMTLAEIIPELLEGKKIRRRNWIDGDYWQMTSKGFIDTWGKQVECLRVSRMHLKATDCKPAKKSRSLGKTYR